MAKTVDLNEKALEKEKKNFLTVCKLGEAYSIVLLSLGLFAVMALIIMLIMFLAGVAGKDGVFSSPESIAVAAINMIMLIGIMIASNFAVKTFNKLKSGETPFRYDIADKIKGAGYALAVCSIVCVLLKMVYKILVETGVLGGNSYFDIMNYENYGMFGVFLIMLGYVFNYGCKLQQEADETL